MNIYTIIGSKNKQPITYSLAYGLASLLTDKKVFLIDSGTPLSVEQSFDNLTIIDGKGLNGPEASLRLMNQLLINYSADNVFVLNAPYAFMQHVNNAVNRSKVHTFLKSLNKNFMNVLSFVKDEQRVYAKALPLLTKLRAPDGLSPKDEKAISEGWYSGVFPESVLLTSSLIHIIDDVSSVPVAMYNEELAYLSGILPYNPLIDGYSSLTKKQVLMPENLILGLLVKNNFPSPEYNYSFYRQLSDYTADSLIKTSKGFISKESLKPLGINSFIIKW